MSEETMPDELTGILRQLAWTLRKSTPDRAGVPSVPTSELAVLKQVLETPGLTVGELSERLGMQRPNTSAVVRSLALRGLVSRRVSEDDRRRTFIRPTALAEAEAAAITGAWADTITDAVRALDSDERTALFGAVEALRSLDRAIRTGRGRPPAVS